MNTDLSFSDKEILKGTACIFLVRGYTKEREEHFFYILVKGPDLAKFKKAVATEDNLDLRKYGVVVLWGEGSPTQEEMQRMTKEYGFNHKDMIFLNN